MDLERLVAELLAPVMSEDPELRALAVAVAIEETFDVVLADEEITTVRLGTRDAVVRLLERRLGAP